METSTCPQAHAGLGPARSEGRRAGDRFGLRQARPAAHDQEPGHVRGGDRRRADHDHLRARTDHGRGAPRLHVPDRPVAVGDRSVREFLRSRRRRARQGAGRFAAAAAHRDAGKAAHRVGPQELQARAQHEPQGRRCRPGRGRRNDPVGRRDHRRHGLGQRGGDHGRVRAGHSRVGRRPLGGHRRHASALGLDSRAHHRGAGLDLPRSHDQAGRGRRAAEDAE